MTMMKRTSTIQKVLPFCVLILISLSITGVFGFAQGSQNSSMTQKEYEARKRGQDQFHHLLRQGDRLAKEGDVQEAERLYLEAYEFSKGSSSESVALGKLARFYESVGEYSKSLELTNQFLAGLNEGEPAWYRYMGMKERLLENIGQLAPQFKKSFEKASHEEQSEALKTFGGRGVWDIFKDAMVAEHGGDFEKAREIYESLLPRKEEIDTQMGTGGWAMLYPAIQRTSELLGDDVREKEALIWIKDNLLNGEGQHHGSLKKLRPEVVLHIRKRIEKFQL